jgi:ketosteroid isomerase-like protein
MSTEPSVTEPHVTEPSVTETVVRNHLEAFLQQRGVAAIVADYADGARFLTEGRVYRGRPEIGEFFRGFIAALPAGAIERFTLRSMEVDQDIAYITWCVGSEIPLGTDTFVVGDGRIVSQTFAMHAVPG